MDRCMVVVDRTTVRDLRLLKEAWNLPSVDAVIRRLLEPQATERIKALGMEVRLPHGEPE